MQLLRVTNIHASDYYLIMNEEYTEIRKRIGYQIYVARVAAGITQAELGAQVGVSFQQMQKYESGSNHITAARLLLVATALDVPVAKLLDVGAGKAMPTLPTRTTIEMARLIEALPDRCKPALKALLKSIAAAESPKRR